VFLSAALSPWTANLRAEKHPDVPSIAPKLELLRVARISGDAKHCAFTGLARFNGAFYCAWREAATHVSGDGKLRVARSADGTNWTPVALMTRAGADLRDAKLAVTPDQRLMLHGVEKFPDGSSPLRRNIAWFTTDGTTWTDPVTIAEDDIWFWKHTWHKGTGYGVGYACAAPFFTRLYASKDGIRWTTHVATLNDSGYVNESSIVFMPDATAHCLLRRDDGTRTALLGTAAPPYKSWKWQDLGRQIGGPEMIRLPDNRLLAAVRQYPQATWLCWVDPKSGTLTPALKLPSGGDTSYAGMVWHDDRLWVSYYSSHEKRTGVYIAEVACRPGAAADIGTRRELFVDKILIDSLTHAALALQPPVDKGVVFRFDRPWEGMGSTYVTVIRDGALFRMHYRGQPTEKESDSVTCYAESKNGLDWVRPDLGLHEVQGTRNNNVILTEPARKDSFAPFLDHNPGARPSERYKATASGSASLAGYTSPDGIHWTNTYKTILRGFEFDSLNVAFWSEVEKRYVCYYRDWHGIKKANTRRIRRATTTDFSAFRDEGLMEYSYPNGGAPASYEHHYVNGTHPYPRAPHQYIALAARFQGEKAETDPLFMTSRAGSLVYDRLFPGPYFKPAAEIGPQLARSNFPVENCVQTGPRELSFYVGHKYRSGANHLRRYSLRLDGFVAVSPTNGVGELLTKPLTFAGKRLTLNYRARSNGKVRVEIRRADGTPVTGYALADAVPLTGDEIDGEAAWKSGRDVSALAGQPVRLRFVLENADLFALQFQSEAREAIQ
jgi:hypothetical protein